MQNKRAESILRRSNTSVLTTQSIRQAFPRELKSRWIANMGMDLHGLIPPIVEREAPNVEKEDFGKDFKAHTPLNALIF